MSGEAPADDKKASAEQSVDEGADEKADSKESEKEEPKVPGVTAQSRQTPMMRERLANYLAASGANVERDEIGWLIAEWGSGPGLVVLDPALS